MVKNNILIKKEFLAAEFFLKEKYKQEIDRISAKIILEQYLNRSAHP